MTTMPAEITYGHVTGRFIAAWTDGPDAGRMPDPRPLEGLTVKIVPKVQARRLAGSAPVLVATMPVTCKVDADGRLIDEQGNPGVWLVTGVYGVSYAHPAVSIPAHDIEVTDAHTEDTPLDLVTAQPPGGPVLTASQYAELSARIDALGNGGGGGGVDIKVGGSAPASGWWLDTEASEQTPPTDTDITPPVTGTLAASAVTATTFTLTVAGASDAGTGLHATPYRFSTDNGATWSAWQAGATFNVTGKDASTAYTCRHQVRDAAPTPNVGSGSTITVTTAAPADPADPADPAPLAADDFNRADTNGGGLGATSTGGKVWADPSSVWAIKSNRAAPTTLPDGHALIDAGTPNVHIEADVTLADESRGDNEKIALIARRSQTPYVDDPHFQLIVRADKMTFEGVTPSIPPDNEEAIFTFPTPIGIGPTRRVGFILKEVGGASQVQLLHEGTVVKTATFSRSDRSLTGTWVGFTNGWDRFRVDNFYVWEA